MTAYLLASGRQGCGRCTCTHAEREHNIIHVCICMCTSAIQALQTRTYVQQTHAYTVHMCMYMYKSIYTQLFITHADTCLHVYTTHIGKYGSMYFLFMDNSNKKWRPIEKVLD